MITVKPTDELKVTEYLRNEEQKRESFIHQLAMLIAKSDADKQKKE